MVQIGYTHYYYRKPIIPQKKFDLITKDFRKVVEEFTKANIKICGPHGDGEPIITNDLIAFNGDAYCGHEKRDLGITWPSDNAGGVDMEGSTEGSWFAGALLSTRTCDGDCSHESCVLERIYEPYGDRNIPEKGKYFSFCKTAYKPYDIAVTAFLIICKHYLGNTIVVRSDGNDKDWLDAKMLCSQLFDYGLGYSIDNETGDLEMKFLVSNV